MNTPSTASYYTPKFDKKYQQMVSKHGDPGFTKGKAYKLQRFTWWKGVTSLWLINDAGEEIGMDMNYVKRVDKDGKPYRRGAK